MRKILSVLTALCLTLTLLPWEVRAAEVDSGNCGGEGDGSNLTWTLDDAGTLTISGSGPMKDYHIDSPSEYTPWYLNASSIISVAVGDQVTHIGNYSFNDCTNLEEIDIPDSVTSIGNDAFFGCEKLSGLTLPSGLTSIGFSAFADCTSLSSIVIPAGVTEIEDGVFQGCIGLASVTIPDSVTSIGEDAFNGCSFTSLIIPDSVTSIGESAFAGGILGSITIPASLTELGLAFGYYEGYGVCSHSSVGDLYYRGGKDSWDMTDLAIFGTQCPAGCDWAPLVHYFPTLNCGTTQFASGAVNPTVVITSDTPFKEDVSTADIELSGGATGLSLASVSLDTLVRAGDNKTLTLQFSGTAQAGELDLTVLDSAFSVPVGTVDGPINQALRTITVSPAPPAPAPDPTPDPTPAPPPSRDDDDDEPETTRPKAPVKRESVDVDDAVRTKEQEKIVISGQGESDMQGILKKGEFPRWIDRVKLPRYAMDLYTVLCIGGDGDRLYDLLIEDKYFTFSGGGSGGGDADVESVLELTGKLDSPYASGGGVFRESSFVGGFDVIDATAGDRAVSYEELKEGDVVRTASYNGIYVTKVRKDGNQDYDADLKTACAYASTVFQAFDRDHPEIFWLSGSTKLRLVTVTMKEDQRTYKETYIFFLIADADGFTVRDPQYAGQEVIEAAILRRDAAVDAILATVPGGTVYDQVAQLNRWLTEHNHYNTSKDLHNLPNAPHECLSALEGNIGADGPVCDGYSRAFKVLCEKLDIPCLLVDGYAKVSSASSGEFHMWNSVKMPDGQWYGVDVTWNDPTVKGVEDAKSGREREDYLLVGADTVVFGLKFSESHPPKNRAANGGVAFINGPTLSAAAFHPLAGASALPFTDVEEGDWCYDAVSYVFDKGLMKGVSDREFSPDRPVTRAMVWTILARLAGKETGEGEPWYARAQSWAAEEGISDGTAPEALVTRQQLAAMLWRFAGSPASGGSLEGFGDSGSVGGYAADALRWAVESGVVSGGSDGGLRPTGSASRAHLAAMVQRFCQRQSA